MFIGSSILEQQTVPLWSTKPFLINKENTMEIVRELHFLNATDLSLVNFHVLWNAS